MSMGFVQFPVISGYHMIIQWQVQLCEPVPADSAGMSLPPWTFTDVHIAKSMSKIGLN